MWRILLFCAFLSSIDGCAISKRDHGNVCVCNATYCDKAPKVEKLTAEKIQIVYTSDAKPGFNVKEAKFTNSSQEKDSVIVEINSKKTYQKIIGFGGSFTDSVGMNIESLPPAARKNLIEAYFGEDGLEYTLCRVPMGGSDFSPRAYTLDDNHNDEDLKKFSLQKEDFQYKIPYMQQAQSLTKGKTKFFISSWTAPLWMKIHEVWAGYAPLQKKYYQTWTDYTMKFLDEFAKHNITYWGLTTGNEPSYGFERIPHPIFGSMAFDPVEQNIWLRDSLGPTLRKSAHKDVKLIILDDNIDAIPWYIPVMYGDSKTFQYIDGVATHWYYDQQIDPTVNYMVKSDKKDIFLIMTELCFFVTRPFLGSWERASTVFNSITEHMEYNYNGYTDWNMALNMKGEPSLHYPADAAIIVNADKKEFYKQPFFYIMGHFSKYVRPDSVRIYSKLVNTTATDLKVVAFERPDKVKAVIVFNTNGGVENLQIRDDDKLSEVFEIPGFSIQTFLYA